jgi:hypothetical protein
MFACPALTLPIQFPMKGCTGVNAHCLTLYHAADALTDWRSAMGKEGLRLILYAYNEEGVNQEDAPQAAEYYLENYRFIYRNPDDDKVCFLGFSFIQFLLTVHI